MSNTIVPTLGVIRARFTAYVPKMLEVAAYGTKGELIVHMFEFQPLIMLLAYKVRFRKEKHEIEAIMGDIKLGQELIETCKTRLQYLAEYGPLNSTAEIFTV